MADDPVSTTYNEELAEVYDRWFSAVEPAAIEALTALAQGGRALELGIGTGLMALPLAERGIEVHGIDASPAMVAKLRAKPGGGAIPVTFGSFADVEVAGGGDFRLIFVVFNTFFALQTQAEQVRCFRNAAARLSAGGVFVVEGYVPETASGPMRVVAVETDRVGLKLSQHDPVRQKVKSQHVVFRQGEVRLFPVEIRYAWPAEMDLMAELAGLRLRHRWGDWSGGAFTAASTRHISIYERC